MQQKSSSIEVVPHLRKHVVEQHCYQDLSRSSLIVLSFDDGIPDKSGCNIVTPQTVSSAKGLSFHKVVRNCLRCHLHIACAAAVPAHAQGFQYFACVPAYADLRISGLCLRTLSYGSNGTKCYLQVEP